MLALAPLFGVTALLYAAVGFGGGSTYNALLVLIGTDPKVFPIVALTCNLIVTIGGTIRFARAGLIDWRRLAPILALSVPAAWLGGYIPIGKALFILLLGFSLLAAGLLLLLQKAPLPGDERASVAGSRIGLLVSAPIGLLSGLVGIGGGIFLAPLLHLVRWDGARRVAAAASIFILANSIAGLGGQLMKIASGKGVPFATVLEYWPLALAVLIGGQIGSRLATSRLSAGVIRRLTAILILYVAARLLWQSWAGS